MMSEAEIVRPREERRLITVLFADLVGFTTLVERLDPEEARDLVRPLLNQLGEIVRVQGGYVDKFLGDGLIALFGAPEAHEDDPRRAIQAALQMQGFIQDCRPTLPTGSQPGETWRLRIGITTGEAVVGAFTSSGQADYTAIGDTVNTAQRLETLAQPGQVLVARTTYQLTQPHFLFRPLPAVQLKGKQVYIQPYEVLKAITKPVPFATPFVNRVSELTQLKSILARVMETQSPAGVVISGEPGIGKSRLSWEFRQYLVDSPYLTRGFLARGYAVGREPYGLLSSLLITRAGILPADSRSEREAKLERYAGTHLPRDPLAHHFLGYFLGLRYPDSPLAYLEPQAAELSAFATLKDLLEAQAVQPGTAPTPHPSVVVILLDDLHWADEASLRFLSYLTRAGFKGALMLIVISRPFDFLAELGTPFWTRLELTGLGKSDADRFVSEALLKGKPLPAGLQEKIRDRTKGNPFFLEELLKNLFEEKWLVEEAGRESISAQRPITEIPLPTSLYQLLEARIDLVSGPERAALQRAAVLGDKFTYQTLTALMGQPPDQALSGLASKGLILKTEPGTYEFKHGLIQETAYKMLTRKERQRYHQEALAYLQTRLDLKEEQPFFYYSQLGRHSELTEDLAQAVECYTRAAGLAQGQYANDEAIRLYTKVLDLSLQAGQTATLEPHLRRAGIYQLIGRLPEAEHDYQTIRLSAQQQGNQQIEIKALIGLGNVLRIKGEYPQSLKILEEALAIARETGDRRGIEIVLSNIGNVQWSQGDYPAALKIYQEALAIAREIGDRRGIGIVLGNIGNVHGEQGDYPAALKTFQEALVIAREIGDRQGIGIVLGNIGNVQYIQGDYPAALKTHQEALAIAREIGNRRGIGIVLDSIGNAQGTRGDYPAALKSHQAALKIFAEMGNKADKTETLLRLAQTYLKQAETKGAGTGDDLTRAEGFIQEAMGLCEEMKSPLLMTTLLLVRSRFLIAQGKAPEARPLLEEVLTRTRASGERPLYAEALYQMSRACTGPSAQAYLVQARALATELGFQPLLQEMT